MSNDNCINKNPLRLKGVAQENRLAPALDPSTLKIDDKTEKDYKRIIQGLAELTQYYNLQNRRDGDWSAFFSDIEFESDKPHIALLKAFFKLLKYAQDDLNKIGEKHLEFYYEEVLQIKKKAATPDEAHIIFGLANNIDDYLVESGTILKADKDANGKLRFYKTEDEIVVNKAIISELKSVYVQGGESDETLLYNAKNANSSDGLGGDLDPENPKWAQFGQSQSDNIQTMSLAKVGFALASDFLLLQEGLRNITITFNFKTNNSLTDLKVTDLVTRFSGAEEWIEIQPSSLTFSDYTLQLQIEIPADAPAVVGYDEAILMAKLYTEKPVFQCLLKQEKGRNVYGQLAGAEIENIAISVNVEGVKGFVLQNETGNIDPSKPFEPFGFSPVIGSEFLIGSKEVFSKKLNALTFNIEWMDKPDLNNHYDAYDTSINPASFKIDAYGLKKRAFDNKLNATGGIPLFASTLSIPLVGDTFNTLDNVNAVTSYENDVQNGFIKFEISAPSNTGIKAFGHKEYQNLYVKSAIELSKGTSGADDLPKAPYTPKVKSFSADYSAVYLLDGNLADSDETTFYHIGPFGARKDNLSEEVSNYLIPYFKNQGALCIGLKKLNLPQTLSLLLQVSEGSANPATSPKPVIWSYLVNNNWVPFNETELLSDTSNGFINTGIIKFALPKTLQSHNTWLTEDTFWISASMETEPDSVAQLIDIQTQAITAVFEDTNNELSHLGEALPAGTIAKLKDNQSAIREIAQPYASFDGRLPENGSDYYRRVSERLRHKNRAITIWDFERLVLEEFPSVYKVKCLNHTRLENPYTERAPGHVSLVVISNLRNKNAVNPLQPRTSISILEAIKRFLSKIQNSFIELHTGNPDFEEIQVEFNVRFYAGKDENFYKKKLLEDIKEFLSPWAYFNGKDISFEGVIHKSKIINFIEELDYVDYLTCFKMYQISKDGKSEDLSEAQPTRSSAILVSAKEHLITVLTDDDCACDDKDGVQIINDGISVMTVALDLIVNKP